MWDVGRRRRGRLLRAGGAVGVAALALAVPAPAASGAPFDREPLPLAADKLFDMGVVDFDGDGDLDSFTLNHRYRQTLLRNNGHGRWRDVLHMHGLGPSPAFPGFEDLVHPPQLDEPGIYLYARKDGRDGSLILRNEDTERSISGDLTFLLPAEVTGISGGTATVTEVGTGDARRYRVDFDIGAGGRVTVTPAHLSPVTAQVGADYPTGSIFVGADAVNPTTHEFTLRLSDRHGMAWADYDGDGALDVFIVTGGALGGITDYPNAFFDELLLRDGDLFENATVASGLGKGVCRGRSASTVDFDGDGALDLLESCVGSPPRLWSGHGDASYTDQSNLLANEAAWGDKHRWIDLDGDLTPELIAASRGEITVLTREAGAFVRARSFRIDGNPHGLAIGDVDGDGDPDIFVASKSGGSLIRNTGRGLRSVPRGRVGLPHGEIRAAAWVDYDNDGDLDLHAVPQGLFSQAPDGRFVRTGLATAPRDTDRAIVSWADIDGDGARDLLQYQRTDSGPKGFQLISRGPSGHWLEVDLTGPEGNSQAVLAEVEVRTGKRRYFQWAGQNETSRYSQGHYRLYVGLGRRDKPVEVNVRWPDGGTTHLDDVAVDRLIEISR